MGKLQYDNSLSVEFDKAAFVTAVEKGTPTWVRVNHGEGTYQETDLFIAPGVRVAIPGIDAD